MNLFSIEIQNLLPFQGEVLYYGKIFNTQEADRYYEQLMNTIDWKNDEAIIYGKKIITKRKVAWYAEQEFSYTYSKVTKTALLFNELLTELKTISEKHTNEKYNSCLLNLYHTGDEGMAWHSDGEKELKKDGAIASLSFGATRKFAFKHKESGQKVEIILEHGSLLLMRGCTQSHWLHRLPPTTKVTTPRVNLTFRSIERKAERP